MVTLFADGAKLLGIPKSVGEVYGILYASKHALALDGIVDLLGMSKGSVSQALKMLRVLGAITEANDRDNIGRKTYYQADIELKSLVGGFIQHQVRPHLENAENHLADMRNLEGSESQFYTERIDKLESWRKKAGFLLPLIQRYLGSK